MQPTDKQTDFYLSIDGKELGPLTLDELLKNGMTTETLVWWPGAANWAKAGSIPELHELLQQPVPQSRQEPTAAPVTDNGDAVVEQLMSQLAAKDLHVAQLTVQLEKKEKQLAAAMEKQRSNSVIDSETASVPSPAPDIKPAGKSNTSNILLFAWIVINALILGFWLLFGSLFPYSDYYNNLKYHLVVAATDSIYWLSWFLIPFAITNKKLKIAGLILITLIFGYRIFQVIRNLIYFF